MDKIKFLLLGLVAITLGACGPSQQELAAQTATEQQIAIQTLAASMLTVASWTKTPTPTFTASPTPPITSTPSITPTPRPTSTPVYGTFNEPAPVGHKITLNAGEGLKPEYRDTISATILEIRRGLAADTLAQSEMDWLTYKAPIEGQEYIAVKIQLDVSALGSDSAYVNEAYQIRAAWHFTLRNSQEGTDTWAANIDKYFGSEGYLPQSGTGWVFWLVRKNTKPTLYFQPELLIAERAGERTSGAFFSLEQP